jgi:hypothetical protein
MKPPLQAATSILFQSETKKDYNLIFPYFFLNIESLFDSIESNEY